MMSFTLCYILMAYGITLLLVDGMGPFDIIDKFRNFVKEASPSLGKMFDCYMCTSTNVGWMFAIAEYLLGFNLSPVSILLDGQPLLITLVINMLFTCGAVWIIKNIVVWFENQCSENGIGGNDD